MIEAENRLSNPCVKDAWSRFSRSHIFRTAKNIAGSDKVGRYDEGKTLLTTDEELKIMERWGSVAQARRIKKPTASDKAK